MRVYLKATLEISYEESDEFYPEEDKNPQTIAEIEENILNNDIESLMDFIQEHADHIKAKVEVDKNEKR